MGLTPRYQMITAESPSKPFVYTAKGTPRRHVIIKTYEAEINALYDAVDQSTQKDIDAPTSWEYEETLDFIRTVILSVLGHSVADDDDIFQHGCDRYAVLVPGFSAFFGRSHGDLYQFASDMDPQYNCPRPT